jgi:hypothetical protein
MVARNLGAGIEVCWHIIPLSTPHALRHCAQCGTRRRFVSSDKFRLNAQQRKIDVWLVYKCLVCAQTWNCTIVTRQTPEDIGEDLYQRFVRNDRMLAWRYAFDSSLLHRAGVRVDEAVAVRVEQAVRPGMEGIVRPQQIRLVLDYPCTLRLDRLLAQACQVSRASVHHWYEDGLLQVWPAEKHPLRKPIRHGQVLFLAAGEGLPEAPWEEIAR